MTLSANPTAAAMTPATKPMVLGDFVFYGLTVFAWSTSWIAQHNQIGVVAPEVSLLWRYLAAAVIMWLWIGLAGHRVRFSVRQHAGFLLLGLLMFSLNFTFIYYASGYLASGLLSVVFSLASVFNVLVAWLLQGTRVHRRVLLGGLVGFAGVGLMFWPAVSGASLNLLALIGLALAALGTLSFSLGNIVSGRMQREGVPVLSAAVWGMTYGTALLTIMALVRGVPFTIDLSPVYLGSLAYLVIVSSVIGFWSYLTLLGRIGSARAGYSTVMFPVFALAISTVAENYQWTFPAFAGLGLVLAGNLLVLRPPRAA